MTRATFALLFGFRVIVTRRSYLLAGILLFALKYSVDLALSAAFATYPLDPVSYANPLLSQRLAALGTYPDWLPIVMGIWALPFIWIGVSMSARRALNARYSPLLSLLFFVPLLNYLLIVLLCTAPEANFRPPGQLERPSPEARASRRSPESVLARLRTAALSAVAAAVFGSLAALLSVFGAAQYGSALFIGAPFLQGVIAGVLLNFFGRQSVKATTAIAVLSVTLCAGVLLLLALEGALCLAMAAVLAYPLAILGAQIPASG